MRPRRSTPHGGTSALLLPSGCQTNGSRSPLESLQRHCGPRLTVAAASSPSRPPRTGYPTALTFAVHLSLGACPSVPAPAGPPSVSLPPPPMPSSRELTVPLASYSSQPPC